MSEEKVLLNITFEAPADPLMDKYGANDIQEFRDKLAARIATDMDGTNIHTTVQVGELMAPIDFLFHNILMWGIDKGIIPPTGHDPERALHQIRTKLKEEVEELEREVEKFAKGEANNRVDIGKEAGDVMVVLLMVLGILHLSPQASLSATYDKIAKRKGYTDESGVFHKE